MADDKNLIYSKLDKLDEKLDRKFEKLDNRVDRIDKELAIYNSELTRHIEGVQLAREEIKLLKEQVDCRIEPLERDLQEKRGRKKLIKDILNFSMKVIGFISLISGTIYGVIHLLTLL